MAEAKVLEYSSEKNKKGKEKEKNRGKQWSEAATMSLIDMWGQETVQVAFDSSKSSKQSSAIYKSLLVSRLVQVSSTWLLAFSTKTTPLGLFI